MKWALTVSRLHADVHHSFSLLQIDVGPPDLADEEAVAYYNAQHGLQRKMSTLKRGMQGTRRRPGIAKF